MSYYLMRKGFISKTIYMKKIKYILCMFTIVGSIVGLSMSFAWLTLDNTINDSVGEGSITGAYFGGGDGTTAETAYKINNITHLYNLAWLQDINYFKDDYVYFELTEDISPDNEMVLPPIGTETYPFKGNFNGNGHYISNITISNNPNDMSIKPIVYKDAKLDSSTIVGFFGVIGSTPENISNATFENGSPTVTNLMLDKITIKSSREKSNVTDTIRTLVGIIAGYVNGTITDVGVYQSSIATLDNILPLSGYDKISKYTLIGDYNNKNITWNDDNIGDSSTDGNNFGGSIDMKSLNRRLNYIGAVSTVTKDSNSYNYTYSSTDYNVNIYITSTREPYWKNGFSGSTAVIYVNDGTCIPLNVNTDKAFVDEISYTPTNGPSTWHTSSFYKSHKNENEIVLSTNTGYLIGGNPSNTKMGYIRTRIQSISGISESYDTNTKTLNMYSVNTKENNTIVLIDSTNYKTKFGYTRFTKVMEGFNEIIKDEQFIHGFHFMNKINESNPEIGEFDNIYINTNTKPLSNYQMVKGGLNFTVSKRGYITAILGSFYANARNNQSIFNLYKVERNSSHQITSFKKIYKIYEDSGDYAYSFNSSESIGNLVFDFDKINSGLLANSAYYFEFPVLPGDYVIGKSDSDSDNNAYLMYLDIGANAGDSGGDSPIVKLEMNNVKFIREIDIELVKSSSYLSILLSVSQGAGSDGTICKMYFKRSYYISSGGTGTGIGTSTGTSEYLYYKVPVTSTTTGGSKDLFTIAKSNNVSSINISKNDIASNWE